MKPIAEPLITNKQDESKSQYWRLNSNINDDGASILLDKQQKTSKDILNADISCKDGSA